MTPEAHPFLSKHKNELTDFALVELMREQIARKNERKKRGINGWIDHSFNDDRANALYQLLAPQLKSDWFWNDLAASVIRDMCEYEFWDQPSVNLVNIDETKSINIKNNGFGGDFKVFAMVDLFQHTANVVASCATFYEHKSRTTSYLHKLVAMSSLLHDIGKHYGLMRKLGIIPESLLIQHYKHHEFSARYIRKKINTIFSSDADARASDIEEVVLMVYEHHGVGGNSQYQSAGSADLREIDKNARMIEYTDIKTGRALLK